VGQTARGARARSVHRVRSDQGVPLGSKVSRDVEDKVDVPRRTVGHVALHGYLVAAAVAARGMIAPLVTAESVVTQLIVLARGTA